MQIQTVNASFVRPADNTQYTAGDHVTATGTAVPLTFTLSGERQGKIIAARAVVTPASSSLVITALDFDLLLFNPATDIPFATGAYPADNAPLTLTAAAYREAIGTFSFVNSAWRNPLGAFTASTTGFQMVTPTGRPFKSLGGTILGVVQILGTWNPGNVANTFNFSLDIES